MRRRFAFTLIELLAVVAILGLLVAIMMPSLAKVRGQARLVTCASQLHQVGLAMMAYMHDSRDRMPHVSFMPSIGPAPLTTDEPIYLADVLKRHLSKQADALQCPEDRPGKTGQRAAPNTGLSFFQSERSSYVYRISLAGLTPMQFSQRPHGPFGHPEHTDHNTAPNMIWFARDYDNFHGKAGEKGARRYVYIDGHVEDYVN